LHDWFFKQEFEDEYARQLFADEMGAPSKSFRMALGALLIKSTLKNLTDEQTVEEIRENPYLQYFTGLAGYQSKAPFDPSMMVHFRTRISAEMLQRINERIIENRKHATVVKKRQTPKEPDKAEAADQADVLSQRQLFSDDADESPQRSRRSSTEKRSTSCVQEAAEQTASAEPEKSEAPDGTAETAPDASDDEQKAAEPQPECRGKLLVDATCVPADIRYPTVVSLLNEAREKTERIIDIPHLPYRGELTKPRTYRQKARKAYLQIVKHRRKSKKTKMRKAIRQQLQFLRRNLEHIRQLSELTPLSALPGRLYQDLLVISELYRQQQEMYDRKVRSTPGRIVSISQPHVRPIVRGKDRSDVEFGAKVSVSMVNGLMVLHIWKSSSLEAYHEGNELKSHIEAYYKRFGWFPASVHTDKIYQTRVNRAYCKARGIRLSGPPSGRPPKDQQTYKELKQLTRADELLRIPIEGCFGNLKRRYGFDLVKEKLAATSENTIAMTILAMNLDRILRILFWVVWHAFWKRISKRNILEICRKPSVLAA